MKPLRASSPSRPLRWILRRTFALGASVLLCGVLGGCEKERPVPPSQATPEPRAPAQVEGANFELVVLNASPERRAVDIQVHLDGRLEVDQTFSSEGDPLIQGPPPHRRFQFRLAPGPHTLEATSRAGGATLERRFDLTDRHWALLGYAYGTGPHTFAWQLQATPILFE